MLNLVLPLLLSASPFTFDKGAVGSAPADFAMATTQAAPAAKWVIKQDGKDKVLAQVEDKTKARFALAVAKGESHEHVSLTVRLKGLSGYQAQGIVFRHQGADDYYVARTNTAERNVQLLRFVAGKRAKLVTVPVEALKTGEWHTLRVDVVGQKITVFLGERKLLDAEDPTFAKGGVGLWAKDDTVAHFDDFTITPLPAPVAAAKQ